MRFSALKMLTFCTAFSLVFHVFTFSDVSTAFITVFCVSAFTDISLAAYGAYFGILRLCKLYVKFFIKRKYRFSKPFTDNMRISDKLRTDTRLAVVKQDTMSVIIITALTADKSVYLPALF